MHNRTTNTKSNGEAFPGDSSWEPSENLHEDLIRLDYVFKFVLVSCVGSEFFCSYPSSPFRGFRLCFLY